MSNVLELMSDEQRAKISAVQRAMSQLNAALEAAAEAGVSIDVDTIDATPLGRRARTTMLGASVSLPSMKI